MALLAEHERLLPDHCGFNFRDFGGYATADGRHVKTGVLFRAGMMASVEDLGRERLAALGIVTICDLRTTHERERRPTRWAMDLGVDIWSRDYGLSAADLNWIAERSIDSGDAMRRVMIGTYRDLPFAQAPAYRAMFERLVSGRVPLLVNCSAGKDRTGTAAALVLSALGVPRDTVLADYELTARADFSQLNRERRIVEREISPEVMAPLMAADASYLEAMFEAIEARSGSFEAYLADELGVGSAERARMQELLLDD